jgi:hypothetical protein
MSDVIADHQSSGVLFRSVTKGLLSPVVRPGLSEPPSGVAAAQVDIASADVKALRSVETDSNGAIRVSLPIGTHQVSTPSLYGAMFIRDLPAIVTIATGQEKRFDIHLDTVIR